MKKLRMLISDNCGQSTIEYAIVVSAVLVIVVALSFLWKLGDDGIFVEHALAAASHHLKDAAAGIVGDLFSY